MENNKYIYYGMLFYFLYIQIYKIISSLLVAPVLIMHWNIHIVPILLLLFVILLPVLFYKVKQFPKIRIWFIILIVVLSVVVSFFNIPKFYLSSSTYSLEEKSMISNYTLICGTINIIAFIAIAYVKYLKMRTQK